MDTSTKLDSISIQAAPLLIRGAGPLCFVGLHAANFAGHASMAREGRCRRPSSHREEGRCRRLSSHREEGRCRRLSSHREEGRCRRLFSHREEGRCRRLSIHRDAGRFRRSRKSGRVAMWRESVRLIPSGSISHLSSANGIFPATRGGTERHSGRREPHTLPPHLLKA